MRIEMSGRRVWRFDGDRAALIEAFRSGHFPGGPLGHATVVESEQEPQRSDDVLLENDGVFTLYLGDDDFAFDTKAWRSEADRDAIAARVAQVEATLDGIASGTFSDQGELVGLAVSSTDASAVLAALAPIERSAVRDVSVAAVLISSVPAFPVARRLVARGRLGPDAAAALARWGSLEHLETGDLDVWVPCRAIVAETIPATPAPKRVRSLVITSVAGFEAARGVHRQARPSERVERILQMRADLGTDRASGRPGRAFPAFADGWKAEWMDWEVLERLIGPIAREWADDLHTISVRAGRPIPQLAELSATARSTDVASRVQEALAGYAAPEAASRFFARQAEGCRTLVAAICSGDFGNSYLRHVGGWIGTASVASGVRDTWDGAGPLIECRNVARWDHWVASAARIERRFG